MSFKQYLYNTYEIFTTAGAYTWTKPSGFDSGKPILVHVWGAGGCGGDESVDSTYTNNGSKAAGGGGGGLAVKYVSNVGDTETITVGAGGTAINARGGTSSFGSHCSATGGNGGQFFDNNENYGAPAYDATTTYAAGDEVIFNGQIFINILASTGADPTTIANWRPLHGVGGMGVGGDVNRRGGTGGQGHWDSNLQAGGGGGGSAPAPYGVSDGFNGGVGNDDAGGGGAGIGANGGMGRTRSGGSGGGSMSLEPRGILTGTYSCSMPAGQGILGYGGNGVARIYHYVTYGGAGALAPMRATGELLLTPNQLLLGGGGGTGGGEMDAPAARRAGYGGMDGAPGGGGGGVGNRGVTDNSILYAGDGGLLGGGGGSAHDMGPGEGGNGGGGGGRGDALRTSNTAGRALGHGGDGLVIIQYSRKV